MREARCDCCDLPVYSCGRAAEQQQRQEQAAHRASLIEAGWFPAQWPGSCGRCGHLFPADTLIVRDDAGWRAECCS